jgi:hypothetical protein
MNSQLQDICEALARRVTPLVAPFKSRGVLQIVLTVAAVGEPFRIAVISNADWRKRPPEAKPKFTIRIDTITKPFISSPAIVTRFPLLNSIVSGPLRGVLANHRITYWTHWPKSTQSQPKRVSGTSVKPAGLHHRSQMDGFVAQQAATSDNSRARFLSSMGASTCLNSSKETFRQFLAGKSHLSRLRALPWDRGMEYQCHRQLGNLEGLLCPDPLIPACCARHRVLFARLSKSPN